MDSTVRSASAVHRLRASENSQPLHPAEKLLLGLAAANLVFLPWALGGMPRWAQGTAFALAAAAFVVALIPRTYSEALTSGSSFRLYTAPRLLRFPFFWLGLLYFAFIAIQLANPAWVFMQKEGRWWVESVPHIAWLPHGVKDAPFRMMNAWRTLLIHGSVWLLVCALWIGLTRRRSARFLLVTIALNGAALALVAVLQRLTGSKELLWLWPAPSPYFVATIIYKNHAGAFFALIAAVCAGFAWWHSDRAARHLSKSHPGFLFVFLAVLTAIALLFTYARASTALGFTFLLVVGLSYLLHALFRRRGGPPPVIASATALICAAFLGICLYSLNVDRVWEKFGRLFKEDQVTSIENRRLATSAAIDMGNDSPWFGHGYGGFRFVFPWYQRNYPQIFTKPTWVNKQRVAQRLYWEHAHNDYAELYAEGGWTGVGFALALLALIAGAMRRAFVFSQPPLLVMLGGALLVALAAIADFPLHNPAILATTAALIALVLRWSALDRTRRPQPPHARGAHA